ncbi:hypothetical protein BO85DRAFT_17258 [Aspergillus piperis CBS 112811]|uniref:Uncharacterized protein n=1 Tax=Aspergillus piperis CBS 112811 TaxID=1448313 RepID=A0A8G1RBD7_9EURO|nr:hypothetical protein BO85DRAFT_17258 [Aspergillus piperis CBS 112811]RAH63073.1 hypothetical protein BO85DRAFT_17258 [Aspergillus piperis CBS 112811]
MANQCSGHVFVIVQATNGNILTWRCSDCNSGPFVAIWRCKIFTHAFLPLNRLIRTFPKTSEKPSAALLAPYLPKAYQPFLARLDLNQFSHFVCFSIRFGFSCNSLKKIFSPSLRHTAHCPLGLLVSQIGVGSTEERLCFVVWSNRISSYSGQISIDQHQSCGYLIVTEYHSMSRDQRRCI